MKKSVISINLFLCMSIFLASSSLYAALPNNVVQQLHNKFQIVWQDLKDFRECAIGARVCSPKEKAAKYAAITAVTLVMVSALIAIVSHTKGLPQAFEDVKKYEQRIAKAQEEYRQLEPKIAGLSKTAKKVEKMEDIEKEEAVGFMSPTYQFREIPNLLNNAQGILADIKTTSALDIKKRGEKLGELKNILTDVDNLLESAKSIKK